MTAGVGQASVATSGAVRPRGYEGDRGAPP